MASKEALLKAIPVGKENAISMKELEQRVGNSPKGTNNDQTRREVSDLVMKDKLPIITSPHDGVYFAKNRAEVDGAIAQKKHTIAAHQEKIQAYDEAWKKHEDGLKNTKKKR